MAKLAIRGAGNTELVHFRVFVIGRTHELKLHIGAGDTEELVLTPMLPNED